MADQIVLAWTVDTSNTVFGPTQAAAALAAVPLYTDPNFDPVICQMLGLRVDSDASTIDGLTYTSELVPFAIGETVTGETSGATATVAFDQTSTSRLFFLAGTLVGVFAAGELLDGSATGPGNATVVDPDALDFITARILILDMTPAGSAPSLFPCHPRTSTPASAPYPIQETATLPGSFYVENGVMSVPTTASQKPSLSVGDSVQFLAQEGVFYTVASVAVTTIGLTAPYTGVTGNTRAFKEVEAPVTLAAIYSTSDLDTAGVATTPAISAGSGARTVEIAYNDSTGVLFFTTVSLTGKRPAAVPLAPGSIDIAVIQEMFIASAGAFGNSVGQITLAKLSAPIPPILSNRTPEDFPALTDEAQLLIEDGIAYLPPSYLSVAQQRASAPSLVGDFIVSTGSASVPTTVDQTGALAPTNTIEFAAQPGVRYVVSTVTAKIVTLTTPYTGLDPNIKVGESMGLAANTRGDADGLSTGAMLINPTPAAPPSNDQLSAPLAQFVALETAAPPLNPPLNPSTVPTPTFLSGLFTQTLQLGLAGVPVVPQPITFL